MTPTEQAARWLADEPCFDLRQTRPIATMQQEVSGEWMRYADALAAIARHLAPGDLVERLSSWDGSPFDDDAHEAAARIAALTAERDQWRKAYHDTHDLFAQSDGDAATLRDRLARMEGALDDEAAQEVGRLRLQAFATNLEADRMAYFKACSKWFQNRHVAALTDGGSNG